MPQSPLLESAAPAAVVDLAGWRIAEHYGDPAAEVAAVHAYAGLIDRSERGRIAIAGADRQTWLNRIVSNDTSRLSPGDGVRALLVTNKGRIGCDMRVFALPDRLLVDTAFDTAEGLLRNFQRYLTYGDRVTLADQRGETAQIGVHGAAAPGLVSNAVGVDAAALAPLACVERNGIAVLAVNDFGMPGFDVVLPAEEAPAMWDKLAASARPFGWRAAEILRLEAGLPRWGAELREDYLPLEAELEDALSHTKGCYPGQEYVARMRDRGHANRLLRALVVDGETPPPRGAKVLAAGDDKEIGHVTSAERSPTAGVRALAYVRREHEADGTRVWVEIDGERIGATVQPRGR